MEKPLSPTTIEDVMSISLAQYNLIALRKTQEELCLQCYDKKCETESYCFAFGRLFKANLWTEVAEASRRN